MKNAYEIRGDFVAIYIDSPKYGRIETLIDLSDLQKAEEATSWCVDWKERSQSFYVKGGIKVGNGPARRVYLHRHLFQEPALLDIDHINGDTLDNRRCSNLRACTHAENLQNRKGTNSNNSSGIRGVRWNRQVQRWQVLVRVNYKTYHIGFFKDKSSAETAAIEGRGKLMPFSHQQII